MTGIYRNTLRLLTVVSLLSTVLTAGTTGKISGTVRDAESLEGLIGCNVIVDNSRFGASVNLDGSFYIIGIEPGEYSLTATMIGYQQVRISEVMVRADLTTNVEFELPPTILQSGEVVEVVAKRATIVKDLTATSAIVSAEQIASMPVTDMGDIINLQAGMVDGHMRGGRSGEVAYWIDGIPVTDVYDGGQMFEVSKDLIQELQVISGAFNAEYGQAMSGIVNVTTKTGYKEWGGNLSVYAGDYLSSHDKLYMGIDEFNPITIKNLDLSLHGPIIKDKLDMSFSLRDVYWQGWLNGQHLFNPWAVAVVMPDAVTSLGADAQLDSLVTQLYVDIPDQGSMSDVDYDLLIDSLLTDGYAKVHGNHTNSLGDGEFKPMQWNHRQFYHGRVNWYLSPGLRLSFQGSYTDVTYQDYERSYRLNPYGDLTRQTQSYNYLAKLTHSLNVNSYYSVGLSRARKTYFHYNEDDYVVYDEVGASMHSYAFPTAGTNNGRFNRESITDLIKIDYVNQVTSQHQVKAGVEYRQHTLSLQDSTLQPPSDKTTLDIVFDDPRIANPRIFDVSSIYNSQYEHKPIEFSAYIQDKIELKELIINIGVRMDYFKPDGHVLADPSDPSIYEPLRLNNIYHDTDNNGIYGNDGDVLKSVTERSAYWYTQAEDKLQFSPRFGASFPITDKGVVHVSYGHFLQIPRFEHLYRNPDFDLDSGTGNIGVVGNADLKPEKTISGEIGITQEIMDGVSLDLTGYFRDIRNLIGTNSEQIEIFGGSAYYNKIENSDFAYVKGMVLALNYFNTNGISGNIDYTFQVAEGTASDPEEARNSVAGGAEPGIYIRALNWDQRHTVNMSANYNAAVWGVSAIGAFGSGLPYTPNLAAENTLLTNSASKPVTLNLDLNVYYKFNIFAKESQVFLRVQNVLDHLNQTGVYDKTGVADFTPDQQQVENLNVNESINTVEEWFRNETFYSEPRRIELGLGLNF
ncbi:MAG: TonB-dependent receptor [Candidatus Marinimicrobia bacterium]|nr:TonB-dependent receptor [Candidatus Neomarinimicrobiota bacterium]MBT3632535.1 TonB-dependent receptor [Candidatus Neomarinimicrobiota bacterium]MBT3824934.1 TonB-dependent receptor [Candidatus Neomarinimicrobiota bacterium]MBT4132803.1 TonB-dependent receptor [Candidatus Neomarinimicrobiota bacterium]MBT4295275.1 TonB-dependent receptor [Candidatus Neomarinimicrobiota bacterium]